MIFHTQSGSIYELDTTNKKIRRLTGKSAATPRQDRDEVWKNYRSISKIEVGVAVLIGWEKSEPLLSGSPDGAFPTTMTSVVVKIVEENTLS